MKNKNNYDYLLSDLTQLTGVGKKTMAILKKTQSIFPVSSSQFTLLGKFLNLGKLYFKGTTLMV